MDRYGWDLNTVDNQDRTALREIMDRLNESNNGSETQQEETMTMAEFVRSGKSHELGL